MEWNNTTRQTNCTVDTSYRFTFYQVSYSIIFLVGLATNSIALRKLCLSPPTRSGSVIYMASLLVADLFFVISLPLRIYFYHQKARASASNAQENTAWMPGAAYCQLTFTLKYISLYGGIFFLVCIAVDRYFAVVRPLTSTANRLRAAQLVSGAIWCLVLGISVCLPLLRSAASHRRRPCLLDPSSPHHRVVILTALGVVLASFLLPTALLLFSYCRVLRVLRQPRHCSGCQRGIRRHTLTVIYWVLAVYLLCFVPYHVNLLGYTLTHMGLVPNCFLAMLTKAAHPVVLTLASSNCCLNPLVYYFSSKLVHRMPTSSAGSGSQ